MTFDTKDFSPTNRRSVGILRAGLLFPSISPVTFLILAVVLLFNSPVLMAGSILTYTTEPTIRVLLSENRKHASIQASVSSTFVYQGVNIAQLSNASISFHYSSEGTPVAYLSDQMSSFYPPRKIESADSAESAAPPGDPLRTPGSAGCPPAGSRHERGSPAGPAARPRTAPATR